MRFEVLILGNSSATPMYDRHPTSQVVNFNEQLFLIDCGEGTQMQLSRYGIKSNKINHIFIFVKIIFSFTKNHIFISRVYKQITFSYRCSYNK